MKSFFAALFATTAICLLTACASPGGSSGSSADGSESAGNSGVTVFGTLDAGVSTYKNR